MTSLDAAFAAASPRITPRRTPLSSGLIHGAAIAVWLVLLGRAFGAGGPFAWSVGLVYVLYDTVLLLFIGAHCLVLFKRSAPAQPEAARPTLGVIVASHNEASVLQATLAGLAAQDDRPDIVMIADDGSDDATPNVLMAAFGVPTPALGEVASGDARYPSLRWLRLPRGGKARALNAALTRIDTEVIMTVDADTVLDRDAVGAMRRAFAEPGLVAATGILTPRCAPSALGPLLQWFQTYEYVRNFIARFAWMRANGLLLISGAFAGYRRDALVAVGGLDPDTYTEDYELTHRMRRYASDHGLDWRVRVVGDARARTDAPSSVPQFLRQRRRWFGGFLQTQYWYREMTGNRRYGAVGTVMLPIKALDTLQPIYGLTAIGLLFYFLLSGRAADLVPAFGIILAKIVFDLAFYVFTIVLYRRWVRGPDQPGLAMALVAAVLEPFTFQLLRHLGAALGWVSFLTRSQTWAPQRRPGLTALPETR